MFRRRDDSEENRPSQSGPSGRSWSARIAWLTLFGGAALVVTRLSVATVLEIHGDGMAPTLMDGDHVVLLRDDELVRGDIVVYDPAGARPGVWDPNVPDIEDKTGKRAGEDYPDARRSPEGDFRNTAVVDREELEDNWKKVQSKSSGIANRKQAGPLRLGRVLAAPGDRVTFHARGGALGLAVDGALLPHKDAQPIRIALRGSQPERAPQLRALAYENTEQRRYPVLVRSAEHPPAWPGLALPPVDTGPVEIEAPGYLIVADNRDDGDCCDSRALGWIPADAIRGKVLLRLPGDPEATPDLDPAARGLLWDP